MKKPSLAAGDTAPAIRPGYHEHLKYGYIPFELPHQDLVQGGTLTFEFSP